MYLKKKIFLNSLDANHFLTEEITKNLLGPSEDREILSQSPKQSYLAGVLYPQKATNDEIIDDEEEDTSLVEETYQAKKFETNNNVDMTSSGENYDLDSADNEKNLDLTNELKPSAMGISVCINLPEVLVVSLKNIGQYFSEDKVIEHETDKPKKEFIRKNINLDLELTRDEINSGKAKSFLDENNKPIGLAIHIMKSKFSSKKNKYLTFQLVNQNTKIGESISLKHCFFQCNFEIKEKNNLPIFEKYEEKNIKYMNEEEKSLHLLHRNKKSFSIGHGCSSSWNLNDNGECIKVFSEIFPSHEIKPIRAKKFNEIDLNMIKFSQNIDFAISEINKLIVKYDEWLVSESNTTNLLDEDLRDISKLNIKKAKSVSLRIKEGLSILTKDKNVQNAFMFMNKAMAEQQFHYMLSTADTNENESLFKGNLRDIDYDTQLKKNSKGNWYPFQIAFIILNIKSFTDPLSDDRKIMDLIWFPTGGGKTEAYLGLSAFVIFLRKILSPSSTGNVVIMRYTLRLLTTQQFFRASTLICACEKIRTENEKIFGKEEINIGVWIGGDATPNTEAGAKLLRELLAQYKTENKFLVINCPWCGAGMGPKSEFDKSKGEWKKIIMEGYRVEGKNQHAFACENKECFFSHKNSKVLPIYVVDDTIYKKSPSLIIGTIDKFASLPWRVEAINCFKNDKNKLSTDLIIQDELHLISGPLGSVAGMYEILINAITAKKIDGKEVNAKIIGSTATISRAENQIRSLYAKKGVIFPPQTNQIEDSFFSYENQKLDGRKYFGIFCPSSSSPQITLTKTIASLLIAGKKIAVDTDFDSDIFDPYWTQVIYFNSIRELMGGATLISDDVKEELNALYVKKGINVIKDSKGNIKEGNYDYYRPIYQQNIGELTSRQDSSEIPVILKKLFVKKSKERSFPLDVCLATNMIQVGIDVPRLSLMVMNGQPKTTSEYIQASSRVGRDMNKPGLVFTILSPFKPRDRSHYEHFKSYHQSLYNFVEPTSVTPHSDAVRKRCLHAVVIGLCRLWDEKLSKIPNVPSVELKEKITKYILEYIEKSDPDHPEEIEKTKKELLYIFRRWESITPSKYGSMSLDQSQKGILMYPSGSEKFIEGYPFETPTSMRNVDKECAARISETIRGER